MRGNFKTRESESEGRDVNADCKVTLQPNLGSSCLPCCKISSVVTVLLKDDGDRHHHGEGQPLPLSSAVSCLTSPPIAIILPGMSPCPACPSSKPPFQTKETQFTVNEAAFSKGFQWKLSIVGEFSAASTQQWSCYGRAGRKMKKSCRPNCQSSSSTSTQVRPCMRANFYTTSQQNKNHFHSECFTRVNSAIAAPNKVVLTFGKTHGNQS